MHLQMFMSSFCTKCAAAKHADEGKHIKGSLQHHSSDENFTKRKPTLGTTAPRPHVRQASNGSKHDNGTGLLAEALHAFADMLQLRSSRYTLT